MKNNGIFGELVAEVFGTFILVLLGVGVVANVGLAPRMGSPAAFDWLLINIGWCFAVVVAVYTVGRVSGAHLNPAVTLAMAVKRGFPWGKVIPFWVAQFIGAFLGAAGVFLVYRDGLVAAGLPNVFTTGPGSTFAAMYWGGDVAREAVGSYSLATATFAEIIGTAVLLWGILGAFDSKNLGVGANLGPLFVGFTVLAVGASLGGASGYAINPARDLAPRIFATLIGAQGTFDGIYWLVAPVIGPLIGGVVGIVLYDLCVTPFLPAEEKVASEQLKAVAEPA
jgi:glycerol uptake facilitator protein